MAPDVYPQQTSLGGLNLAESRRLMERMSASMPGGDTRTSTYFLPFPIALDRGQGHHVWDVDGNQYIDLLNNFTSLVHGHAHPEIVAAVARQAESGFSFSAPHRSQGALADRITERIASVERVRFTNSGTEAVMQAVRAARAVTGRDRILKAHGGYHGSWEQVPMTRDDLQGAPRATSDFIQWVDFNDVSGLESAMASHGGEIAAVIFEPVMGAGGVIAGDRDFFAAARRLCTEYGALLIFDEVITARLNLGGYQEALGVTPDLTTLGKVIGGGLPVGAVGGSASVMDIFDPRRDLHLYHGGTFNGNPMTMAAGVASLDMLDRERIDLINDLGARAAQGMAEAMKGRLPGTVTSVGSLIQLHPGAEGEVSTFSDVDLAHPLLAALHIDCLEEGLYVARRGLLCLSTVMNTDVVDEIVARFARAVEKTSSRR